MCCKLAESKTEAMMKVVDKALEQVTPEVMRRGFETRVEDYRSRGFQRIR